MINLGGSKIKYTLTQRMLVGLLVCFVVFNYNFSIGGMFMVSAEEGSTSSETVEETAQVIEVVSEPAEEQMIFEEMNQQMDQAFKDVDRTKSQTPKETISQAPDTSELDSMSQQMDDSFSDFTDSMNNMVEDVENMFGVSEQIDQQQTNNTDTEMTDSAGTGLDDLTGLIEDATSGGQNSSADNNTAGQTSGSTSGDTSSSGSNQPGGTTTTTGSNNNQTSGTGTGGGGSGAGDESAESEAAEKYAQDKFDQMGQSFEDVFGVKWQPPEEIDVSTHDVDGRLDDKNHEEDDELGDQTGDDQTGDEDDLSEEGEVQSDGSSNDTQTSLEMEDGEEGTQIVVDNNTEVSQDTDAVSDTGNNLVEVDGRMEGSLMTGNASLSGDQELKANNTEISDSGSWNWTSWEEVELGEGFEEGEDGATYIDGEFTKDFSFVAYNDALVDNDFDALVNTGYNTLRAGEKISEFTARTGDVWGKLSLVNLVNVTSVSSLFKPLVLNIGKDWTGGSLDLMNVLLNKFGLNGGISDVEAIAEVEGDDTENTSQVSAKEEIRIQAHNTGLIFNDISFEGISGRNDVMAGRKIKEMILDTGNVEMSFNLFNLLNANFLYSDVSFVVVNVFDDFVGDIILPSPNDLFPERLTQAEKRAVADLEGLVGSDSVNQALAVVTNNEEVTVQNDAYMDNYIETIANTGQNEMYFSDDAEEININSGKSKTLAAISNMINQTLIGGSWFDGVFNIFGDWQGELKNLPDNAIVQGDDDSFVVSVDNLGANPDDQAEVSAVIEGEGDDSVNQAVAEFKRNLNVDYKNEGRIVNKIHVAGDSGSNEFASTDGKKIDVDTGNVKVSSNISNIMNTNVIGAGVMKFALNMFADNFDGNIVFGKATDVRVEMSSSAGSSMLNPGDVVTYNIEVANIHEDELATGGELLFTYDGNKTQVSNVGGGEAGSNQVNWSLGELNPGETKTYQVKLKIKSLSLGIHDIQTQASVDLDMADRDKSNNSASVSVQVLSQQSSTSSGSSSTSGQSDENQSNDDQNDSQDDEYEVETAMNDSSDNSDTGSQEDSTQSGDQGGSDASTSDDSSNNDGESASTASSASGGSAAGSTTSNSAGQQYASSKLSVSKYNKTMGQVMQAGDEVEYGIVVKNNVNESLYDVVVYDTLVDENGNEVYSTSWPLDEVYPLEEITIKYGINLLIDEIKGGRYTNYAYASGFDKDNKTTVSPKAESAISVAMNPNYNPEAAVGGTQANGGVPGGGDLGQGEHDSEDAAGELGQPQQIAENGSVGGDSIWQVVPTEEFDESGTNQDTQKSALGTATIERDDSAAGGSQAADNLIGDGQNEQYSGNNEALQQVGVAAGSYAEGPERVELVEEETRIFRNVPLPGGSGNVALAAEWNVLGESDVFGQDSGDRGFGLKRLWMWLVLAALILAGGYYSWSEKNRKLKTKASIVGRDWKHVLKN